MLMFPRLPLADRCWPPAAATTQDSTRPKERQASGKLWTLILRGIAKRDILLFQSCHVGGAAKLLRRSDCHVYACRMFCRAWCRATGRCPSRQQQAVAFTSDDVRRQAVGAVPRCLQPRQGWLTFWGAVPAAARCLPPAIFCQPVGLSRRPVCRHNAQRV